MVRIFALGKKKDSPNVTEDQQTFSLPFAVILTIEMLTITLRSVKSPSLNRSVNASPSCTPVGDCVSFVKPDLKHVFVGEAKQSNSYQVHPFFFFPAVSIIFYTVSFPQVLCPSFGSTSKPNLYLPSPFIGVQEPVCGLALAKQV